ncbi:hypothetical protein ACPX19_10540 [Winogradskyella sp. HB-48]|uniref:hypothetical protein n=1 Tax=Winogradskyella sp. HB-48 TaxID=3416808 RepID=UPI003CED93C1
MKETKYYTCEYCFKEYEPKRRRVQKYCSNSCRSSAFQLRKASQKNKDKSLPSIKSSEILQVPKTEKISAAGVGNAALGVLAVDAAKSLLTSRKNKPATKGDIDLLIEKLGGRYHFVKNLQPNIYGDYPFYDLMEGKIVYLKT